MSLRIGYHRPGGQAKLARRPRPNRRLSISAVLVLLATLSHAVPCRAGGLVIEAPNFTATAGSTGSFDLLLVNTEAAGGASFNVAADSFELSLAGPLAVTFTDVSINTIVPYIYVTSGTTQGGGPLSLDAFPNTQFTASDAEFALPGFRTLNPGDVFGLGSVAYTVDATTPNGTDTILISSGASTSLADGNFDPISFTITNGSIKLGTNAVPEPAALTQAALAAMIGLGAFWWRRRKRVATAR